MSPLDSCTGLTVHPLPTKLESFAEYGDPVSIVKDESGKWYASGFRSVYVMRAKGKNGGLKLVSTLKSIKQALTVTKKKGESSFHGSYALVDDRGNYYVALAKNVMKYKLQGGDHRLFLLAR